MDHTHALPNQQKMRVFVTGSTGLVGGRLVELLADAGHRIVAMSRQTSDTSRLAQLASKPGASISLVAADVLDSARIAEYMQGCDVVVHVAAVIDPHGDAKYLREVNVDGTNSVLEAAINSGVSHFVHISSLSVIMGEGDRYGVTEDEPLHNCREAYANSKVEAERIVMSAADRIKVTALRPGFIYGPNEKTWLLKLIKNMRAGRAMLVGDGSKETNLIYVDNLCRAVVLSMLNPVAYGQVYNLTDGELVTKRQLFDLICDTLAIPRVRISISMPMARFLVNVSTALASIAPAHMKERLALFSRPALRLVALNQGFDISKAERELHYVDRVPFKEGMSITLQSYAKRTEYAPAIRS